MSPNKPDETSYLLENIPRELWNQARAKAIRQRTSIKAVLKALLETWVNEVPARAEDEREYADVVDSGSPGDPRLERDR